MHATCRAPSRTDEPAGMSVERQAAPSGPTLAKRRIFPRSAAAGAFRPPRPRRRSGVRPRSCRHPAVRSVSPADQREQLRSGRPSASAAIWGDDGVGALADIDRALMQHHARRPATGRCRMVEGLGIEVLPHAVPACSRRRRRAASIACVALNACDLGQRRASNAAASASRQGDDADADCASVCPVTVAVADAQRIAQPELQPVHAELVGQLVDKALPAMMVACGTPKPRKAPEIGPLVWIAAPLSALVAASGRAPTACTGTRLATVGPNAGIGAGVEVAGETPCR